MQGQCPVDILIVDDNPAKLLALETALLPLEQNVVRATSGRDALRQLLGRSFATVILDVNMPDVDGFETAQLIRGRPASASTPIIFVSAINLAETDALRGYALGAVDYIVAPIVPEILRAKVSVFVELHRRTEDARRHAREVEERTRELELSQQQLRLAERMAALGTLSAGVGHDMGNLLLPIQAQLESLEVGSLPSDAQEAMRSIGVCVGHLRRLANGLRLLAMDPDHRRPAEDSTDLTDWWMEMEPVLRNVLPRTVLLERSLPADLPAVGMGRHLLSQAVFNLVQNAGDAMRARERGSVRVWAERAAEAKSVRIGVTDDGPGMTDEVQRRCMEPFFTTKPRGISTGLGLSLVHGIIQRVGGELAVRSRPGQGTTFSFVVPAARIAPGDARPGSLEGVVSLEDKRMRSLAASLLVSRGVVIVPSVEHMAGSGIWITDVREGVRAELDRFLTAGGARRAIVIGEVAEAFGGTGVAALRHPATPTALRSAIYEAASQCAGDEGTGSTPPRGSGVRAANVA